MRRNYPGFVVAGLDPAIHVLLLPIQRKKDVDAGSPGARTRFALLPGNDGELFAGSLSARLLQNRETLDAL
jgi:hypothetical protein